MKWAPRFSLRTLFILITACALAVFLGLLVHQRGVRQERACAEIYRLGGGAGFEPLRGPTEYDWCFNYIGFVNINTPVSDADLAVLEEFAGLRSLGLADTRLTDQTVGRIARLRHLEFLDLQRTAITDAAVPHLSRLKKLEELYLQDTTISDEGIEKLRKELPQCEIVAHYTRRCRRCRQFYETRKMSTANLCPVCEP